MPMPELLKQRGMLSYPWACPGFFCGARCDPRPVLPFLVCHFTHCTVCVTSVFNVKCASMPSSTSVHEGSPSSRAHHSSTCIACPPHGWMGSNPQLASTRGSTARTDHTPRPPWTSPFVPCFPYSLACLCARNGAPRVRASRQPTCASTHSQGGPRAYTRPGGFDPGGI